MRLEDQAKAIIAASIKEFNARLSAAKTIEERAAILHEPVWITAAREEQEREIDALWAALDAQDAQDAQDATDDMDWQDMGGMFEDC